MNEYYRVLEVEKDATEIQLKKAYRQLAKKYHPDLHPNDPNLEKKIREINDAYAVLSDPEKRKKYDSEQTKSVKKAQQQTKPKTSKSAGYSAKPDFERMHDEFERFFGFQPKSGEITNEEKLKSKNPLDTSDLFDKFMGL